MPININELVASAYTKRVAVPRPSGPDPLQQALARLAQLEGEVAVLHSAVAVLKSAIADLQSAIEVKPHCTTIKGYLVKISGDHVSVESRGSIVMSAPILHAIASQIKGDTASADFSGMVKCDVIRATTVVGTNYTPGAGNLA